MFNAGDIVPKSYGMIYEHKDFIELFFRTR